MNIGFGQGIVKIADFGSAKIVSEPCSPAGEDARGDISTGGSQREPQVTIVPSSSSSPSSASLAAGEATLVHEARQKLLREARQKAVDAGMDVDAAMAAALKEDRKRLAQLRESKSHGSASADVTENAQKGSELAVDPDGDGAAAAGDDVEDGDADSSGSGVGLPLGTPQWMAPEVVRCEVSSFGGAAGDGENALQETTTKTTWKKADIWSLACTVLEMSSGKPPYHTFSNPVTILFHIASSTEGPPLDDQLKGDPDALEFMVREGSFCLLPWQRAVVK